MVMSGRARASHIRAELRVRAGTATVISVSRTASQPELGGVLQYHYSYRRAYIYSVLFTLSCLSDSPESGQNAIHQRDVTVWPIG